MHIPLAAGSASARAAQSDQSGAGHVEKRKAHTQTRERPSSRQAGGSKGPSIDLQYARVLRADPTYAIEGIASDGTPSRTLYHWTGSHWQYVHPDTARCQALHWLEDRCPSRYSTKTAADCVAAAVAQMDRTTSISEREAKRGDRVIVPLREAYLELRDGSWCVFSPTPDLGMIHDVPAILDMSRIAHGTYTPGPVPAESKFGQYLRFCVPAEEDRDRLAEIAAASLIPRGFEKAFVLLGDGANGKSTMLHIIEAFHPTTHCALRLDQLDRPFGLGTMPGKSLAIAWETPPFIGTGGEQVLKSLISRDTLASERKHRDPIDFTPRATIYIAANSPPRFTDHSDGLERKIEYFAFSQKIAPTDRDVGFAKKITGDPRELTIVLDWMLAGATRLVARGGFTQPTASQESLTEAIRTESDSVYAYLVDHLAVLPADDASKRSWYTRKDYVYTVYRDTTIDGGQKPMASPQFWRQLKARMDARGQTLIEIRGTGANRTREVNLIVVAQTSGEIRAWVDTHQSREQPRGQFTSARSA